MNKGIYILLSSILVIALSVATYFAWPFVMAEYTYNQYVRFGKLSTISESNFKPVKLLGAQEFLDIETQDATYIKADPEDNTILIRVFSGIKKISFDSETQLLIALKNESDVQRANLLLNGEFVEEKFFSSGGVDSRYLISKNNLIEGIFFNTVRSGDLVSLAINRDENRAVSITLIDLR